MTFDWRPQRVVLIGSVLVDVLVYVRRLPERGADTIAKASHVSAGGGFNVLHAAKRLGLEAPYGGLVGDGRWGTVVREAFDSSGIAVLLEAVTVSAADTGFVLGMVEEGGERTFITVPGCESALEEGLLV